jgi:hypothetical protein
MRCGVNSETKAWQAQRQGPAPAAATAPVARFRPWGWRLRRLTDGVAGAGLAAAVYGGWAVWANAPAGLSIALRVAMAHAALSAALTYFGTGWMRRCFRAGRSRLDGACFAFCGGLTVTYALLIGVHSLIGTPHLALTLAAGVLPNLLFCSAYALLLSRTGLAVTS